MRISSSTRLLCAALMTGLPACGGSELTLPGDGGPSNLRAVSGGGQEGTVGSQLPDPLVVRLTDGAARALSGVSLEFSFQSDVPAAKIEPATIATNDSGFASVRVRLGKTAGRQTVEARLADVTSDLRTTFDLTARDKKDNGRGGEGGGRGRGHDDDDD